MTLNIAAVGDSHTGEWTAMLEELVKEAGIDAAVCNHGVPGALVVPPIEIKPPVFLKNSAQTDERLKRLIEIANIFQREIPFSIGDELRAVTNPKVSGYKGYYAHSGLAVIILQGGANDLGHLISKVIDSPDYVPRGDMERFVEESLGTLKTNYWFRKIPERLKSMLSQAKKAGANPVYLSIPPLGQGPDEHMRAVGNSARKVIDSRMQPYCMRRGITYVDVASPVSDEGGWLVPGYTDDSLHLNSRAQRIVAETISKAVKPLLYGLHSAS